MKLFYHIVQLHHQVDNTHSTLSQAIKQTSKNSFQRVERATEASVHAFSLILKTVHLSVHCQTMLDRVVYRPTGYMHNEQSHAVGKTTNKRLIEDSETRHQIGYTASQRYKSQDSEHLKVPGKVNDEFLTE
jgi:hypothetical protein